MGAIGGLVGETCRLVGRMGATGGLKGITDWLLPEQKGKHKGKGEDTTLLEQKGKQLEKC